MSPQLLLLVMAFVAFVVGMFDYPPVNATRCICLGLALITLAQIIK